MSSGSRRGGATGSVATHGNCILRFADLERLLHESADDAAKGKNILVVDDINENKSVFDVNKKITDVMGKYLSGENDQ